MYSIATTILLVFLCLMAAGVVLILLWHVDLFVWAVRNPRAAWVAFKRWATNGVLDRKK